MLIVKFYRHSRPNDCHSDKCVLVVGTLNSELEHRLLKPIAPRCSWILLLAGRNRNSYIGLTVIMSITIWWRCSLQTLAYLWGVFLAQATPQWISSGYKNTQGVRPKSMKTYKSQPLPYICSISRSLIANYIQLKISEKRSEGALYKFQWFDWMDLEEFGWTFIHRIRVVLGETKIDWLIEDLCFIMTAF